MNQETVKELIEQIDIVDIISDYVPLISRGKNFFGVCPFHDDHSPSMSVSKERKMFKCFTCGVGGNVFNFVSRFENVTYNEAIKIVADKTGIKVNVNINDKTKSHKYDEEYQIMDLSLKYFQNNLQSITGLEAKKYLKNRGLNDKTILDFGIGVALNQKNVLGKFLISKKYDEIKLKNLGIIVTNDNNDTYDMFRNRIIFPLYNPNGQVVGFSGRIYNTDEGSKYMNSPQTVIFQKGTILYNYHLAINEIRKLREVIIVEGNMDVIRLYSNGFKNVIGLLGTALTSDQVNLIKKMRSTVYLCLDNDDAGKLAMSKIGQELINNDLKVNVISLSGSKDPDEYVLKNGPDSFEKLIKHALSFIDYQVTILKNKTDNNKIEDVVDYVNNVISLLNQNSDELTNEIILKKISKENDLDYELLKSKIKIKPQKNKVLPVTLEKNIKNKYDEASKIILGLMITDSKYIRMYKKKLGFFPNKKYREVASEILYFYEINKDISIDSFISAMAYNENVSNVLSEIVNMEDIIYTQEEIEKLIEIIKEKSYKDEVKELKSRLNSEIDINKKIEIAKKIAELKKDVLEDGK